MLIEHLFRGWTRLSGTVPDVRWRPKNCKHINRRADGSAARRSVRALRGLPEKNRAPVPGIPGLQQSQFATLAEPRPPKIPMQGSGQSRTQAVVARTNLAGLQIARCEPPCMPPDVITGIFGNLGRIVGARTGGA